MKSILRSLWNKRLWWTGISILIIAGYAAALQGLRTDAEPWRAFPWQLCAALSTFAGLALVTGGFGITAMLHLLRVKHATDLRRMSLVLTACAYVVAVLGTATNVIVSKMSGEAIPWFSSTVLLQTLSLLSLIVLALAAEVSIEIKKRASERAVGALTVVLSITGVITALLYNSQMARLFTQELRRSSGLWPTENSSATVFLSGVCGALAIIILACWYRSQLAPLATLGRLMVIVAVFWLAFRAMDLGERGLLGELWGLTIPATFLGVEVSFLVGPILLLGRGNGDRNPSVVYACAALVLSSLILNRMNTFMGTARSLSGTFLSMNLLEILASYGIVCIGVLLFLYLTASFKVSFSGIDADFWASTD